MKALVDNDVILKGACYGLLSELFTVMSADVSSVGALGAAKFVVPKALRKKALIVRAEAAVRDLDEFMSRALLVEPTDEEQTMAADFELLAQRRRVPLDTEKVSFARS